MYHFNRASKLCSLSLWRMNEAMMTKDLEKHMVKSK